MGRSFEELIAEANAAPVHGWDFAWLEGRASEERPSWHYSELVAQRITTSSTMLDLETGGGEMLTHLYSFPRLMVATEGWKPNIAVAANNLRPRAPTLSSSTMTGPHFPSPIRRSISSRAAILSGRGGKRSHASFVQAGRSCLSRLGHTRLESWRSS